MVEEQAIDINGGRHPVIDLLLEGGQFVANDTKLSVCTKASLHFQNVVMVI